MAALVEEALIGRQFCISVKSMPPEQPTLLSDIRKLLSKAQLSNTVVVMLIDSDCEEEFVPIFGTLLDDDNWKGGLLSLARPARNGLGYVPAGTESVLSVLASKRETVAIRTGIESSAQFRFALISLVHDLSEKIVRHGPVMRSSPNNDGLNRKPLLTNVSSEANS